MESSVGPGGGSSDTRSSRRCRAMSDRVRSTKRRHAVVISQPLGSSGRWLGHVSTARTSASWTASSAVAKSAPRWTRAARMPGIMSQLGLVTSAAITGDGRRPPERPHWTTRGSAPPPGAADNSPANSIARWYESTSMIMKPRSGLGLRDGPSARRLASPS
jgi:hypothetical protein